METILAPAPAQLPQSPLLPRLHPAGYRPNTDIAASDLANLLYWWLSLRWPLMRAEETSRLFGPSNWCRRCRPAPQLPVLFVQQPQTLIGMKWSPNAFPWIRLHDHLVLEASTPALALLTEFLDDQMWGNSTLGPRYEFVP